MKNCNKKKELCFVNLRVHLIIDNPTLFTFGIFREKIFVVFECLRKNSDSDDLDLKLNEKCQEKIVQRVKEANKSMVHYFEEVAN